MNFKKTVILVSGIILLLSGSFIFLNSAPDGMKDEIFIIEKGDFLKSVAKKLSERNLIRNDNFFVLLAMVQNKSTVLSGKYKIYKGSSSGSIINRLSSGDIIKKKIVIPEGFNIYETAELLDGENITDGDEFLKYSVSREFINSLGIDADSIEGFLFPDTYVFAENQDARDVLFAMNRQFRSVIKQIDFSNLKKLNLNTYELINLASLVEKEARIPSERRYISAVFHNRLRKNIKLGCDPTIRYAVKKFKGRITYSDLKYDSPYNTYLYYGLPPTPICSPGRESISAALNPVKTSYLYFVARNDGSHYFSGTLREHNKAVEFYQKGINNGFVDEQKLH
ncbi:MAG: endolytic transglycosylase MltG [Spirochaetes bacterium]|nr:endolytic transglycosylase MltG [Spirochaetota bacterium]